MTSVMKEEVKFVLHQTEEQSLWNKGLGDFCVAIETRLNGLGTEHGSSTCHYMAALIIEIWKEINALKTELEERINEVEFKEPD